MTEDHDPNLDEILDVLTAGSRVLARVAARSLDRSGADLTRPQCRALVTLAQLGPLSLVRLAGALGVNPSTATRMCDRLIAKDLLSRERVDGRVSLTPTATGLEVVETVTRERRAELARIVSRLDKDQQRELVRCMEAFRAAAGATGAGEWAHGWWV